MKYYSINDYKSNYQRMAKVWMLSGLISITGFFIVWGLFTFYDSKSAVLHFVNSRVNSVDNTFSDLYLQKELSTYLKASNSALIIDISVNLKKNSLWDVVNYGSKDLLSFTSEHKILKNLTGELYSLKVYYNLKYFLLLFLFLLILFGFGLKFVINKIAANMIIQAQTLTHELNYLIHTLRDFDSKEIEKQNLVNIKSNIVDSKVYGFSELFEINLLSGKWKEEIIKYRDEMVNIGKLKAEIELAKQVSHDIRSPLTALNAAISSIKNLPEDQRIFLRSASGRINDIANQLLQKGSTHTNQEKIGKSSHDVESNKIINNDHSSNVFLPAIVDLIVTEKRIQYRDKLHINIETDFEESYGAFAIINSLDFKRVLSNLITNSVESIDSDSGKVIITIRNYLTKTFISIRDNGAGIPTHILEKLGTTIGISHGKESGNGLGVYHAKKIIENSRGSFKILSHVGLGTEVIIEFPKCEPPSWFFPDLIVKTTSSIIAIDDDSTILEIWKNRFRELGILNNLLVFSSVEEFKKWMVNSSLKMDDVFFLVDYEFLNDKISGLDFIEEQNIYQNAVLVTSRYEEPNILAKCSQLNVRLIPKSQVNSVPINVV